MSSPKNSPDSFLALGKNNLTNHNKNTIFEKPLLIRKGILWARNENRYYWMR